MLKRQEGEKYREQLEATVKEYKIEDNVKFINKYLSLEELMQYQKAADIFITAHVDRQQPTSGTLAYALGAGNVCLSTPYVYAQEVLANDVGIYFDFGSSESISNAVNKLLENPNSMLEYKRKAYQLGRLMTWPSVAQRYLNLFRLIIEQYEYEHNIKNDTFRPSDGQIRSLAVL